MDMALRFGLPLRSFSALYNRRRLPASTIDEEVAHGIPSELFSQSPRRILRSLRKLLMITGSLGPSQGATDERREVLDPVMVRTRWSLLDYDPWITSMLQA